MDLFILFFFYLVKRLIIRIFCSFKVFDCMIELSLQIVGDFFQTSQGVVEGCHGL